MRVVTAIVLLAVGGVGACAWWLVRRPSLLQDQRTVLTTQTVNKGEAGHSLRLKKGVSSEEYQAYSVVLADKRYSEAATKLIVLRDHTVSSPFYDEGRLLKEMPGLQSETLVDYQQRNKESYPLSIPFKTSPQWVLITDREVDYIFSSGRLNIWNVFYKKYRSSKGMISVSRIGFNSDMTQALLSVNIKCDLTCGDEDFLLLTYQNGAWSISTTTLMSIS